MDLPKRKPTRLKNYDYSTTGAYFITICTSGRKELLSQIIVGDDAHIVPQNNLTGYGLICEKYINNINMKYENVIVDKYVIMPNYTFNCISSRDDEGIVPYKKYRANYTLIQNNGNKGNREIHMAKVIS